MKINNILQSLGLNEKEAKVYIALLRLNESSATKIAKKAKIGRTLTYQILDKLIDKGLVNYFVKNDVKFFSPADPDKFLYDLKQKEEALKNILPQMRKMLKQKEQPTEAKIYKGKNGLRTILKEILRNKENYIVFGEEGNFQEVLPIFSKQFLKRCKEKDIHERVIARKGTNILKGELTSVKYVPKDVISPATTVVFKDKVVDLIWKEPYYAIVVKNKDKADSYRSYFDLIWSKK